MVCFFEYAKRKQITNYKPLKGALELLLQRLINFIFATKMKHAENGHGNMQDTVIKTDHQTDIRGNRKLIFQYVLWRMF